MPPTALPLLGGGGELVGSGKSGTPWLRMHLESASSWSLRLSDELTPPPLAATQAVKVTIGRLRRKLGEPPIIHTISGIGYRV